MAGGVGRVFHAALLSAHQRRGAAAAAPSQGPADFRAGARHPVRGGWPDGWRTSSARGVFSRSCGCLVGAAFVAALMPLYARGLVRRAARRHGDLDLAFALVWAVGIACALGAAYQAKFHRLAALILLGGAGLVTCISFVWLSAPDLALTQLVVETVTTVLLLLGLRWLPKRIEGIGPAEPARQRYDGIASATSRSRSAPERGWRRSPTRR